MNLGLAPILFVLVVSMTAVKSQILKGPVNALKKVGDSVTLECVTVKKNCDQVEWQKVEGLQSPKLVYRNGQGMLNTDSYPTQRYSVNSTGGCSLTITQLVIGDSGRFLCMQAVESGEETRTSILIVINVTESCLSNVRSNSLDKGDGYGLWCAINIPPKSVEPSNVALSFHDKTVGETETTDENQPLTVKTTLIGTAKKGNIVRVCRASFPPNTQPNYDNTVAFLDVCTTQQLIVSHPVENIAVLPPGPYHEGFLFLACTADGHPPPTFKWTHLKSRAAVVDDTLLIMGDAGDKYTCTARNTVKGNETSERITIEVSPRRTTTPTPTPTPTPTRTSTPTPTLTPPPPIAVYVLSVISVILFIFALIVLIFNVQRFGLFKWLRSNSAGGKTVENVDIPLNDSASSEPGLSKPSRASGNQLNPEDV